MKDVTLILPNYAPDDEVADRALRFLKSLSDSLPIRVKMITVDNGTEEVTQVRSQLLSTLRRESAIYLHSDKPLGYARAVNIGLALADTKYVVVLNNDLTLPAPATVLGPHSGEPLPNVSWLVRLVAMYEAKAGPGVLSAMDYPCSPILYDDSWYSLWMSDRETITKVGYLDETMPFRYHDQDYSIRMVKAGFKVQRTGKVIVGHDEGTTYKKMNVDEWPEQERMLKKHGAMSYAAWREMTGRPLGS